jgi:hypothetical protein
MSTAVATDLTQDRFKELMVMVKEEADATLALVSTGRAPSASSFNPQSVIAEILADAPSAALMPDHVEGDLAKRG